MIEQKKFSRPSSLLVFVAILRRDISVTVRDFPFFLAQVILQPLFLLFVFGKILTVLGYANHKYASLLFPGIVALTAVLTSLQSTALPLTVEFAFTKDIEDRLLAPISTWLVGLEKIVFASIRGFIAAIVMFPVGFWILGAIPFIKDDFWIVFLYLILGCLVGGAMGLVLGTFVPPNRINILFALIITPLLFTGSSQYPWPSLSRIKWFQVVTALNPLTYVSEGLRGSMLRGVPHIQGSICIAILGLFILILSFLGIKGFLRRASMI